MKTLLRNTLFNATSLFVLSQLVPGLRVSGGMVTFLIGGFALAILFFVVKPVLDIISLPLNLVTLGIFGFLTNAIIFYLLTVFVPSISITSFTFPGISVAGFIAPKMDVNILFSFILIAFLQSLIVTFLSWVIKK